MHDKRTRIFALTAATILCLAAGWWLYVWLSGVWAYWGLGAAAGRLLAAAGAALALSAFLIRPIPVKFSAIAVLYLIVFGLLSRLAQTILTFALPSAAALGWLWQGGVLALACSAGLLFYGALHARRTALKRYTLHTSLPVPGGELRIALISDVHMGFTVKEPRLRRELTRLAQEKPDLLIVAGDLVDDRTSPAQMRAACAAVGGFPATYGVYFVYGNHDLACHGPKPPYSKAELDEALTASGVRILDDQSVFAAGVTLIGRHDAAFERRPERASLEQLLEGADRTKPIVLIDHQPREIERAAAEGVTLQLSGHTHAGQVWPMSRLIRLSGFAYGHKRVGNMDAIVSAGMGNRGSALRSGCTAETVIVRLLGPAR